MANLKSHSSRAPTRKLKAVIISGAICGAASAALSQIMPAAQATQLVNEFGPMITAGIVAIAGYVIKDHA
jgi:hypothetical protein